ncbi:hybrid sensor histidine kinase/response regulator [Flavisphingomonas formosensis]|uniref:hybrid sensor histidine kinase/response regulator n=1 Tax=Flavisphingomonas formosensis TaxID=861534 RepID=UPI0012FA5972|nr:NahK/ErcS family hybrid sensor histidine kinase/response regulator [Sphingomonas formosensis]
MSAQPAYDPAAARIAELEAALAKAERINRVLMDRVERSTDLQGNAFSLFETAITLEGKIRDRTADLERALTELAASNAALAVAKEQADGAERRLRDAIDSINEGFAIFDADDRLVVYNATYLSLWPRIADRIRPGLTFAELARMISEADGSLGPRVAPDRWMSERLAQHGVAGGGHVHVLADGRWVQINELRTSEGGIVGVYTDITDVKAEDAQEMARQLAERGALLQATLDAMPQGVCVYDESRRLIAWNQPLARLLALPAEVDKAIGDHDGLLAHVGPERAAAVGWASGDGVPETRLPIADRLLEVRRAKLPGGGMVMSIADVTERLRAAEALRETAETLERRVAERTADIASVNLKLQREAAERLAAEQAMREAKTAAEEANLSKTRFLAAASHDLLQPLNAARLFVSAIADRRLAAPTRALVRQTGSALDSVEDLLEALLEISKLDAGAIVPQPTDFALSELLGSMKAEFAPMARERGLQLRIQTSPLWVRSDMRLTRRILQNLISNALRYTETGSVEVRCSRRGEQVKIEIADTGIGIAREHHAAIFEEFHRLEDGGRTRGMGLGLAIVQRAARMLDTRIKLRSAPGEGSTFSICLPATPPRDTVATLTGTPRRRSVSEQSVLVIDNEASILEGMAAMLGGWGYRVAGARDGAEALAAIESGFVPDIVIADYHLDCGETGDDTVRLLRRRLGAAVPAIVITADRTPELRDRLATEKLDCLNKPVKPAQLRALLGRPMH